MATSKQDRGKTTSASKREAEFSQTRMEEEEEPLGFVGRRDGSPRDEEESA